MAYSLYNSINEYSEDIGKAGSDFGIEYAKSWTFDIITEVY